MPDRPTPQEVSSAPPHEQLRAWRNREEISQAKAGARVGVSQPTWRAWERGESIPSAKLAALLAEVCDVPVSAWRDAERLEAAE